MQSAGFIAALFCAIMACASALAADSATPMALSPEKEKIVRDGIAKRLKNPRSAIFRQIKAAVLGDGTVMVCGEVAAQTGGDARTRFEAFLVMFANPKDDVVRAAEISTEHAMWFVLVKMCREIGLWESGVRLP